jgi:hypothetical protein
VRSDPEREAWEQVIRLLYGHDGRPSFTNMMADPAEDLPE